MTLAAWLAAVTAALRRWLRDGSFWLDEASIALNLLRMDPGELFGALDTGHSFPRLYLFGIAELQQVFGYETAVLRALPLLALAGGALLWYRLLYLRFRTRPSMLLLGLLLSLMIGTWLSYGTMLKQYSAELMLALVPFVLGDAFYDRTLRRGERSWLLLPLVGLTLLSYAFVIPLLGRVLGWYAATSHSRGRALSRSAVMLFFVALGLALAAVYAIELRHTAGSGRVERFWSACVPSGNPIADLSLFGWMFSGWYGATLPFSVAPWWPRPLVWLLGLALAVGSFEAIRGVARADVPAGDDQLGWGSRAAGCVASIGGLMAAAYAVGYPVCPGRLTLFVLPLMQLLALDGIDRMGDLLERIPRGAVARAVLLGCLIVPSGLTAFDTLANTWLGAAPEDLRPLLGHIESRPDLPVFVTPCARRQVMTLPEWQERKGVRYVAERQVRLRVTLPEVGEYWLIDIGQAGCSGLVQRAESNAKAMTRYGPEPHSAQLWLVRMPDTVPGD